MGQSGRAGREADERREGERAAVERRSLLTRPTALKAGNGAPPGRTYSVLHTKDYVIIMFLHTRQLNSNSSIETVDSPV